MQKITILGLHLNYGGVEQSIVNQANILCDNYDVELVVTYKMQDNPSFNISPKVKIKYLTKYKPNREEFKKYIKEKKFLKAFKEGIKSLKILYLKNKTMKDYIKKCDSDIIISSRIGITKLLNKYASQNAITIAEEHAHHNNNQKYIKSIINNCTNIDYLIPASEELTNFYKEKLNNTKCIYIPNCLDYWPKNNSNLTNDNLISIGRLSPEKGFLDLIDVFKIIYDKNSNVHLDIVGDGSEYSKIKDKITEYKLDNNITLHGFKSKAEIHKLLEESSLYLMCSYEESFGIVLIEAASFGIPAIAFSSAQGAKEIIKNNQSGYLIENRDKNEMSSKALMLLNNRDKLKNFGSKAQQIASNYKFETIKETWLKFISNILKND